MAFRIKPIAGTKNRVIIEPAPAETKTASGLYIPETAQEKPSQGTVVAVSEVDGDGKKPVVKVGDVVLYGKLSGKDFTFEGKEYLIMNEVEIYGTLI